MKVGFIGLGIVMAVSAGFVICNTKSKRVRKQKYDLSDLGLWENQCAETL